MKLVDIEKVAQQYINNFDKINNCITTSGGQLTGDLTTMNTSFTNTSLVTKNYVDTKIGDIETILASVVGD